MRHIYFLIALFTLGGCASPPLHEQLASLSLAIPCCSDFKEFKYQPIGLPSENFVELKNDTPAFVFEHGKSFFAAYALPTYVGPYSITIAHQPTVTAISPVITLLDANFAVSRQFDRSKARGGSGYRQILDIFINNDNRHEQYLIISARSGSGESPLLTKTFKPLIIPIGAAAIVANGSEHIHQTAYGPIGSLTMNLNPYQPSVVGTP